jgi:L-arabinonolactonase
MPTIKLLVDAKNELGEGPLWDPDEQRLYWIDSLGKAIYRCAENGGAVETFAVPDHIGSMALRAKGGAVLALRNGFFFYDFRSGRSTPIADPEPHQPRSRFNDGKVDRMGRFIAGSMDYEEREPICGLYQLDPDLAWRRLDSGIICSNGPCWSPDGRTFYFGDTGQQTIFRYDYDPATGAVSNRRSWAGKGLPGAPDGATVDAEGCLWNARVFGGKIIRFAPDGRVDRELDFPVMNLTSVMFGGKNLDVLYVTSMARAIRGERPKEREAGGLFAVYDLGSRGIPEPRFAG